MPRLLCCVILLVSGFNSYAQTCALTPDENSEYLYERRGEGYRARCEGFFVANAGSGRLEVVGLTVGDLTYDRTDILNVTTCTDEDTVFVRAVGIPLNFQYQMDAQLSARDRLEWPVDDVLVPAEVDPKMIGVFAWTGTERRKIYQPVVISNQRNPDDQTVNLTIRASRSLDLIQWRYAMQNERGCGSYSAIDERSGYFQPSDPLSIPLSDLSPGIYCIEVRAKEYGSSQWSVEFFTIKICQQ